MTAARIREAAKVLRDAAKGATAGPWTTACAWQSGVGSADYGNDDAWLLTPKSYAEKLRPEYQANATYIALMAPPVALALADWLDAMAGFVESGNEIPGMRGRGLTEALALADTILGGKS